MTTAQNRTPKGIEQPQAGLQASASTAEAALDERKRSPRGADCIQTQCERSHFSGNLKSLIAFRRPIFVRSLSLIGVTSNQAAASPAISNG
jgi:hypothetical protein